MRIMCQKLLLSFGLGSHVGAVQLCDTEQEELKGAITPPDKLKDQSSQIPIA